MNSIRTWSQGKFIDQPQYRGWPVEEKNRADYAESHLVRPTPTGNAICQCTNPEDADWIASRLNLASELEQLTYEFAIGKIAGTKLIEYVNSKIG